MCQQTLKDVSNYIKNTIFNDNLVTVDCYAFHNCKGLTSVRMGSHVANINMGAFEKCTSLTKVTINARNVNISRRNAFDKGTKLTLRGYENSTVQKYAISNNNRFERITTSKLDAKAFSLKTTSYTWTGGYFYPQVACTNGLLQNVDYKVEYDYNSNAGTHTIEVYGINDYTGSVFLKYTVAKSGQTLTGSNTVKKTGATNSFKLDVKRTKGDGKLTYSSSNTKVATVNKNGQVAIKGCGKTIITVKAAATRNCNAAAKKVTLTVTKASQKISGVASSYTRRYSSKSLTIRPKAAGKITYVSSNKKIAQVSSKGKITFRRKGTVKIKIKAAATSKYNATSRTITIKIK